MPAEIGSILGMLLVVIIILVMAWWVTSLIARQGVAGLPGIIAGQNADEFCVLRQIPVSRGERLLLVRLHDRCLLLGVAQGGVSLLTELTEAEAEPWLRQPPDKSNAGFRKLLRMSTKK